MSWCPMMEFVASRLDHRSSIESSKPDGVTSACVLHGQKTEDETEGNGDQKRQDWSARVRDFNTYGPKMQSKDHTPWYRRSKMGDESRGRICVVFRPVLLYDPRRIVYSVADETFTVYFLSSLFACITV